MKKLYYFLLAILMVAASAAGNKAQAQNNNIGFEASSKCLTTTMWAVDSRAKSSCATVYWSVNGTYLNGVQTSYTFPKSGTYQVCMKVKDSCKKWDTVYCRSITVTACSTRCNWAGMDYYYSNKCRAFTFEGKNFNNGCIKYQFLVYNSSTNTTVTLSPGRVATYTFSGNGTFTVKMSARDTCNNCDTAVYKTITVSCNSCDLKPEFQWKADCRKVKFVAGGNVSGAKYYWYFGDNSTGTGADPSHTYVKDGVYKVCMVMVWTDPNTNESCKKEFCREIKVQCGEPCNIKGDYQFYSSGGTVKFNATSNSGVYYEWDFGDGTTGSGKDPAHQYKKPGTYEVCVKISDKTRKCFVKVCKRVVIEEPCRIKGEFSWTPTSSGAIKFKAASSGGFYYVWNFGDGTEGTGVDPSHTYAKSGTYKVCVTIYSRDKKCKTQICKTVEIKVLEKCNWAKLGASFGYAVNCPKLTLEAKNLSSSSCIKYYFSVSNGGVTNKYYGRLQTLNVTTGVYKVCLTLYDSCKKCDTVLCREITVNCPTKCNWKAKYPNFTTFSMGSKCLNIEAGLNTSSVGCIRQYYSLAGVPAAYDGKTYHSWSVGKPGTYSVCLKLVDTCSGCDTTICKEVVVTGCCNWKAKYPNFTTFSAGSKCLNIEAGLNTSSVGCIKHYYSLAGTSSPWDGKTYHSWTVGKPGTYVICLKMVDTCSGCDTTICKEIVVTGCCNWSGFDFTVSNNASTCTYVLTGNTTTKTCLKYQYTMSSNSGSATTIGTNRVVDLKMTANGTYTICMKVTDTCNKCDTSICKSVKVDCACSAKASFSIDSVNSAGVAYITNKSTGAYYYFWDFGDSSYSTSSAPGKHAYKTSGAYTICLTVYDANKTCSTTYCYTIKVAKTRGSNSPGNVSAAVPVNIYPNPASANFTITTFGNGEYQILDMQGKLVTSGSLNNSTSISTQNWMDGVYLVRITTADGVGTTRLIIQK